MKDYTDDRENQIFAEMLLGIIGNELAIELNNMANKEAALRKALLFLIYLSQERMSPAGQHFIQYLLTDFSALQEYDEQFIYPFIFNHPIKVATLENDEQQVVLNRDFFEKLTDMIENQKLKSGHLSKDLMRKIDTFFNSYKN